MRLNLSVFEAVKSIPFFRDVMEKVGLGKFVSNDFVTGGGKYVTVHSLFKLSGIDKNTFEATLNEETKHINTEERVAVQDKLSFLALLPCGLRNSFKFTFSEFATIFKNDHQSFSWEIEENTNNEVSRYHKLVNETDLDKFPDILITSDLNSLYHENIRNKFLGRGIFTNVMPLKGNEFYDDFEFQDPNGEFSMLTCSPLVMVADMTQINEEDVPKCWADILHPKFENRVIMRGDDDFFCNAVLLPLYKEHGVKGIQSMARSVKEGLHPAEMAKLAGTGSEKGAAIYIMPLFFTKKIKKKDNVRIIWPEDGAIASPVQMLVKKEKVDELSEVIDFITGREMAAVLSVVDAPPWHSEIPYKSKPQGKLKWLGWNYINDNNLASVKATIREEFLRVYDTDLKKLA